MTLTKIMNSLYNLVFNLEFYHIIGMSIKFENIKRMSRNMSQRVVSLAHTLYAEAERDSPTRIPQFWTK